MPGWSSLCSAKKENEKSLFQHLKKVPESLFKVFNSIKIDWGSDWKYNDYAYANYKDHNIYHDNGDNK